MKYRFCRFLPVTLLFILCASCGNISERDVEQAKKAATVVMLSRHTQAISHDSCQGRKPFSPGADRAVGYIARQMEEIGLTPGGADGYLQEVKLILCRTTPAPYMKIETLPDGPGKTVCRELARNEDFTAFNSGRREEVIDIRNAGLVFAGYGIVAPEYGKNDYAGIENPQDKIAVVMVNDPGLGSSDKTYFTGDDMTYYGRWMYKLEEAARQGMKGVLIIHETRGAGYPWSVVRAGAGAKLFVDSGTDNKNKVCRLTGWLQYDKAAQLFADNGLNMDALIEQAKKPGFSPVPLHSRLSLKMENEYERKSSPNVIGYIPAANEKTAGSIVYLAHWDHLGYGLPVNGDSIINGATDNATAVAWLLETARCFKALKKKPAKNIVFLSPTSEETGFLGSKYYVEHPLFPLDRIGAVINLDVIPLWGENNDVTITGYGHFPQMDSLVAAYASRYGRYVMPDPEASNGMFYRSDHFPFVLQGVPAIFAKGWNDNRKYGKEWASRKIREYWRDTYHKPLDQVNPGTDDYGGLMQEVYLFFDLGYHLGNK